MKRVIKSLVVAVAAMLMSQAMASGGGAKFAEGINYIPIEPALVVNYGGPGKARYIKAEMSLRAENAADATEITHHLPLIRDRLISILSAQTEEAISTVEGKEYLRVLALAEINKALLKVEGHALDEHEEHHPPATKAKVAAKVTPEEGKKVAAEDKGEAVVSPAVPSIADIKPVKGPASDLYFNNFVVQK